MAVSEGKIKCFFAKIVEECKKKAVTINCKKTKSKSYSPWFEILIEDVTLNRLQKCNSLVRVRKDDGKKGEVRRINRYFPWIKQHLKRYENIFRSKKRVLKIKKKPNLVYDNERCTMSTLMKQRLHVTEMVEKELYELNR